MACSTSDENEASVWASHSTRSVQTFPTDYEGLPFLAEGLIWSLFVEEKRKAESKCRSKSALLLGYASSGSMAGTKGGVPGWSMAKSCSPPVAALDPICRSPKKLGGIFMRGRREYRWHQGRIGKALDTAPNVPHNAAKTLPARCCPVLLFRLPHQLINQAPEGSRRLCGIGCPLYGAMGWTARRRALPYGGGTGANLAIGLAVQVLQRRACVPDLGDGPLQPTRANSSDLRPSPAKTNITFTRSCTTLLLR